MFVKKEAFEKIKEQLGKESMVSDRSIDEILDTLIKSSKKDDTTLEDFVESSMPFFNVFSGNLRKEVSVKFKEAMSGRGGKDDEDDLPEPPTPPEKPADDEENPLQSAMATILAKLESLENKQKEEDAKRKALSVRDEAFSVAKKIYPASVIDTADLDFDFTQDDAVDKFVKKAGKISSNFGFKPMTGKPQEKTMFAELEQEFKELDSQIE